MQTQTICLYVFVFFCGLSYIVIWKKFSLQWVRYQSKQLFSGKPTERALEHHVTLGTSELKPQMEITPIPILYKDNFTKLPKWDFEDVYIQRSEAQRPVCSKSLQKSQDEEFQHAAIWNIQLWLHKGHLNMSEWNRLAHFNNPFGFMEYRYTDIKKSVDLIPKPKHYQLLPVPNGSVDGCIRCAVVGTSGILNGSRMGKEIDSHDYVFRVNGAVTKGFEEDVGNETSVYVHTSFALITSLETMEQYGFKHIPHDEGIVYVMIPEGQRDFEWIEALLEKKRITTGYYEGYRPWTYYSDHLQEDKFYVLHPDFLRYTRNRFMPSETLNRSSWHFYRPTNGAFTLFLALHTCDIVDVYGFITSEHNKYPEHYYEKNTESVVFHVNHDYNQEIKTWKKLHDARIINLYQRHED